MSTTGNVLVGVGTVRTSITTIVFVIISVLFILIGLTIFKTKKYNDTIISERNNVKEQNYNSLVFWIGYVLFFTGILLAVAAYYNYQATRRFRIVAQTEGVVTGIRATRAGVNVVKSLFR